MVIKVSGITPANPAKCPLSLKTAPPSQWQPSMRLERHRMQLVRTLARREFEKIPPPPAPKVFTLLSRRFGVSYEAIRRIVRSKFRLAGEEK